MSYTKILDAAAQETSRGVRPGAVAYLFQRELELAVNVALAAGRPLLLTGPPGTGKSSLAADVAWKLGRRFHQEVITSRTQAQDLQWRYDAVKRLSDATAGGKLAEERRYVKPGVLWRAFAPASAREHGDEVARDASAGAAVVLLDEIDKAEPDVPNDLLVVLDANEFFVPETRTSVKKPPDLELLIVITSNGERALPPAFTRRCVTFAIKPPDETTMKTIARRHFPEVEPALLDEVHALYAKLGAEARGGRLREPSTAELLDALRACQRLGLTSPENDLWRTVARLALWKHGAPG